MSNTKKKYGVRISVLEYGYYEVEAESKEEAEAKAEDKIMEGNICWGDFEITDSTAEEVRKEKARESVTDNEEALNRKLYEKVSAEMEAYENELLAMPPEEILEHAYAYATKQDIVLALEEHDLSEKQARALLRCDNALEAIFDRWEHTEMAYMDTIRDMISCTANEKLRAAFKEKLRQGGR